MNFVGWVYSRVLTHRPYFAVKTAGEYTHPTWTILKIKQVIRAQILCMEN